MKNDNPVDVLCMMLKMVGIPSLMFIQQPNRDPRTDDVIDAEYRVIEDMPLLMEHKKEDE